jgi:carbon storage regulator CsrA
MLVISRQVGDAVMIGQDLEVAVVSIEPEAVTLCVRHSGGGPESVHRVARDAVLELPLHTSCTPVDIRSDKVRLGLTCPKELSVHRKEVYDAIRGADRRNRLERRGLL